MHLTLRVTILTVAVAVVALSVSGWLGAGGGCRRVQRSYRAMAAGWAGDVDSASESAKAWAGHEAEITGITGLL